MSGRTEVHIGSLTLRETISVNLLSLGVGDDCTYYDVFQVSDLIDTLQWWIDNAALPDG